MPPVMEFCDYYIYTPTWFVLAIQKHIDFRDVRGLTGGRVESINVTGEHPMIQLTGRLLGSGDPSTPVNFSGIIPSISVTEAGEDEESTTIGQGLRVSQTIDQAWISLIRTSLATMPDRNMQGLITDAQLATIEAAVSGGKKLLVDLNEFRTRETVYVSLWAHSLEERTVLGNMLRSIVYSLKKDMIAAHVTDIKITASKGLNNFNFGKVLYGVEYQIEYLNTIRNYVVTSSEKIDYGAYDVTTTASYTDKMNDELVKIYEEA